MHEDEVETSVGLVRRLLASQFPDWADLAIERVASDGTDNAIYRLGDELAVRLPRIHWAAGQPEKEHEWLPRLAPHLPLEVPVPLARGSPAEGYPWPWTVVPWLEGETATPSASGIRSGPRRLWASSSPPCSGSTSRLRRPPVSTTRAEACRWRPETRPSVPLSPSCPARSMYGRPPPPGTRLSRRRCGTEPPVWLHGDLQAGNLLARDGRLSGVIDFGCLGVGDPACDVMPAWAYLSADAREAFRAALPVDDATWARGRGWALSVGLIALPYYEHTNPGLAAIGRRAIDEVLADAAGVDIGS